MISDNGRVTTRKSTYIRWLKRERFEIASGTVHAHTNRAARLAAHKLSLSRATASGSASLLPGLAL